MVSLVVVFCLFSKGLSLMMFSEFMCLVLVIIFIISCVLWQFILFGMVVLMFGVMFGLRKFILKLICRWVFLLMLVSVVFIVCFMLFLLMQCMLYILILWVLIRCFFFGFIEWMLIWCICVGVIVGVLLVRWVSVFGLSLYRQVIGMLWMLFDGVILLVLKFECVFSYSMCRFFFCLWYYCVMVVIELMFR